MAYADAMSASERSKSVAGVAAVHIGAVGLLMVGLTVTGSPAEDDAPWEIDVFEVDTTPPPPKPKEPEVAKKDPTSTPVVVPKPPFTLPVDPPDLGKTITTPGPITPPSPGPMGTPIGTSTGPVAKPLPIATPPMIDPIAPSPRNDPSQWIRDRDYRSSWIRRGMAGNASFQVGVGANGRVTNCTVTRSTGHSALDDATCALISKRARFAPARNSQGDPTTGSFSSSIRWILPD